MDIHAVTEDHYGIARNTYNFLLVTSEALAKILRAAMLSARTHQELQMLEAAYAKVLKHPGKYDMLQINGEPADIEAIQQACKDKGVDIDVLTTHPGCIVCRHEDEQQLEDILNGMIADREREDQIYNELDNLHFDADGNLEAENGYVFINPNPSGDYIDIDGTIRLNPDVQGDADARKQALIDRAERLSQDQSVYHFNKYGALMTSSGVVNKDFLTFAGAWIDKDGSPHLCDAVQAQLEKNGTWERIPGGFRETSTGEVAVKYYPGGGYYDAASGTIVPGMRDLDLSDPSTPGILDERRQEIEREENLASQPHRTFYRLDNGEFTDGQILTNRFDDTGRALDHAGEHVPTQKELDAIVKEILKKEEAERNAQERERTKEGKAAEEEKKKEEENKEEKAKKEKEEQEEEQSEEEREHSKTASESTQSESERESESTSEQSETEQASESVSEYSESELESQSASEYNESERERASESASERSESEREQAGQSASEYSETERTSETASTYNESERESQSASEYNAAENTVESQAEKTVAEQQEYGSESATTQEAPAQSESYQSVSQQEQQEQQASAAEANREAEKEVERQERENRRAEQDLEAARKSSETVAEGEKPREYGQAENYQSAEAPSGPVYTETPSGPAYTEAPSAEHIETSNKPAYTEAPTAGQGISGRLAEYGQEGPSGIYEGGSSSSSSYEHAAPSGSQYSDTVRQESPIAPPRQHQPERFYGPVESSRAGNERSITDNPLTQSRITQPSGEQPSSPEPSRPRPSLQQENYVSEEAKTGVGLNANERRHLNEQQEKHGEGLHGGGSTEPQERIHDSSASAHIAPQKQPRGPRPSVQEATKEQQKSSILGSGISRENSALFNSKIEKHPDTINFGEDAKKPAGSKEDKADTGINQSARDTLNKIAASKHPGTQKAEEYAAGAAGNKSIGRAIGEGIAGTAASIGQGIRNGTERFSGASQRENSEKIQGIAQNAASKGPKSMLGPSTVGQASLSRRDKVASLGSRRQRASFDLGPGFRRSSKATVHEGHQKRVFSFNKLLPDRKSSFGVTAAIGGVTRGAYLYYKGIAHGTTNEMHEDLPEQLRRNFGYMRIANQISHHAVGRTMQKIMMRDMRVNANHPMMQGINNLLVSNGKTGFTEKVLSDKKQFLNQFESLQITLQDKGLMKQINGRFVFTREFDKMSTEELATLLGIKAENINKTDFKKLVSQGGYTAQSYKKYRGRQSAMRQMFRGLVRQQMNQTDTGAAIGRGLDTAAASYDTMNQVRQLLAGRRMRQRDALKAVSKEFHLTDVQIKSGERLKNLAQQQKQNLKAKRLFSKDRRQARETYQQLRDAQKAGRRKAKKLIREDKKAAKIKPVKKKLPDPRPKLKRGMTGIKNKYMGVNTKLTNAYRYIPNKIKASKFGARIANSRFGKVTVKLNEGLAKVNTAVMQAIGKVISAVSLGIVIFIGGAILVCIIGIGIVSVTQWISSFEFGLGSSLDTTDATDTSGYAATTVPDTSDWEPIPGTDDTESETDETGAEELIPATDDDSSEYKDELIPVTSGDGTSESSTESTDPGDNSLVNPADTDTHNKANSIAGIVYNELRVMEIDSASEMRAFGTKSNPLAINEVKFTDAFLSAEDYANSQAGVDDLLGAWATSSDGKKTGIQGPQPFQGAKLEDYKIIEDVTAGNMIEFRGKPQEGYTSNAKEITAMASVFYNQSVDDIDLDGNSDSYTNVFAKAWNSITAGAVKAIRSIFTKAEIAHWPILGAIGKYTKLSYASIYRDYAYPIMNESHTASYTLATYILPTKWTASQAGDSSGSGSTDSGSTSGGDSASDSETYTGLTAPAKTGIHQSARYDETQEEKRANAGDVALNHKYGFSTRFRNGQSQMNASTAVTVGAASKTGTVGISTEGGSGKVDVNNYVSTAIWGSLGNPDWQGFTYCSDALDKDIYGGYGDTLRYDFYQKWEGHFDTDSDGKVTDTAIQYLYYGQPDDWADKPEDQTDTNGKEEAENNGVIYIKAGQNVAADVSPFGDKASSTKMTGDKMAAQGYNPDSCLVYFLKLSSNAMNCWDKTNLEVDNDYHYDHKNSGLDADKPAKQRLLADDQYIDKVETTDHGCKVYVCDHVGQHWDPKQKKNVDNDTTTCYIYTFTHNCKGQHAGVYCGGHAQLHTRGIVYGFSQEQMEADSKQTVVDPENGTSAADVKSSYNPKFIDPDTKDKDTELYGDVNSVLGGKITTFEDFLKSDKYIPPTDSSAEIVDENVDKIVDAEDLFDIDILISREKDAYPTSSDGDTTSGGIKSDIKVTDNSESGGTTKIAGGGVESWKSWTLSNIGEAVSMVNTDWEDQYGVVDTQTLVGGQTGSSSNTLTDDQFGTIMNALGQQKLLMNVDRSNTETAKAELNKKREESGGYTALGLDGVSSAEDELKYIDRMYHIEYALNCVGNVGYSQRAHGYWYGNLQGHNTDCSGFVSNVWMDRLRAWNGASMDTYVPTTAGLVSDYKSALHKYTGPDCGIQPGDIIIKDPNGGSAHALLYIGTFDDRLIATGNRDYLNSRDKDHLKAYTVDCSSMTITASTYLKDGYVLDKLKNWIDSTEPDKGIQKARSGNVRFAARSYVQNPGDLEMYYLDMEALPMASSLFSPLTSDFYASSGNDKVDTSRVNYWDRIDISTKNPKSTQQVRNTVTIGDGNTKYDSDSANNGWKNEEPADDTINNDSGGGVSSEDANDDLYYYKSHVFPISPKDHPVTVKGGEYYNDRGDHMHHGVDYAAGEGVPIYAAWPGTVSKAGNYDPLGFGNEVEIIGDPEKDVENPSAGKTQYTYTYAHMSKIASNIKEGMHVKAGDLLGYIGNTGYSKGAHLHFQINKGAAFSNNTTLDPALFVGKIPTVKQLDNQIKEREESESSGGKTTGTEWPGTKTASSMEEMRASIDKNGVPTKFYMEPNKPKENYTGPVITPNSGRIQGPQEMESYYALPAKGLYQFKSAWPKKLQGLKFHNENGWMKLGDYFCVAANLDIYPRGTIVQTSLGAAVVVDTGTFSCTLPDKIYGRSSGISASDRKAILDVYKYSKGKNANLYRAFDILRYSG